MKHIGTLVVTTLLLYASASHAFAMEKTALHMLDAQGKETKTVGYASFKDTPKGLAISVDFKGLPPGTHGFHIHENPTCAPGMKNGKIVPALKAGGHLDPQNTKEHLGPYRDGHLGDLPALVVQKDGTAKTTLIAPRLAVKDLKNRSIMIHAGGDNYSNTPPLGGGGARIICGVIK